MKVVFDTNVIIGHVRAEDRDSSNAVHILKTHRHRMVVCEKLLREYRGVMCGADRQMYAVADRFLSQMLPIELMEKMTDPIVQIGFGPPEDRFHLQLAIDARAAYHITKEKAILAEAGNMAKFGVREAHPRNYVITSDREGRQA